MKTAYFCMEYAIDQSLKIYSGGLGFLAGSHLRSAYQLKEDTVAVGLLYNCGYYDQERNEEGFATVKFTSRTYDFLQDIHLVFPITIHHTTVYVKAFYLPPEVFGTAPLYLLSTDIPENDHLARTTCMRLYDANQETRIAQSIVLGIGGVKLLELLKITPEVYHLNEGHGLPLIFALYAQLKSVEEVKKRMVFTTHTPEKAGNDVISLQWLDDMGFFNGIPLDEIKKITLSTSDLNYTLTALRFSKVANAVSRIHQQVAQQMWKKEQGVCEILAITNAQNADYWTDPQLKAAHLAKDTVQLLARKKVMKQELFQEVLRQTGKKFKENVLTVVWARRVAGYKRIDLLFRDCEKLIGLLRNSKTPIQLIIAGKPYPEDRDANALFNRLIEDTKSLPGCTVLVGYELQLSGILKRGADVWLNTPRYSREASGTSGMTAAMNGTLNLSIADGWFPEFVTHGHNGFVVQPSRVDNIEQVDQDDYEQILSVLEGEMIPTYYTKRTKWTEMMCAAMQEIVPAFGSHRMITEYRDLMYRKGLS